MFSPVTEAAGVVRAEQQDRSGYGQLPAVAEAVHRRVPHDVLDAVGVRTLRFCSAREEAGREGVDPDPLAAPLAGQVLRQVEDRRL